MLIGNYLGVMSEARRVAVPKKFLLDLSQSPILAKWYEDCLLLVGTDFWNNLSKRLIGERNTIALGVRDIERFILGSAFEIEADEVGRIVIPEPLARYAGLTKEIVFIGLIDRVEIWNKEIWDEKAKTLEKTTKEFIEEIAKRKIRNEG